MLKQFSLHVCTSHQSYPFHFPCRMLQFCWFLPLTSRYFFILAECSRAFSLPTWLWLRGTWKLCAGQWNEPSSLVETWCLPFLMWVGTVCLKCLFFLCIESKKGKGERIKKRVSSLGKKKNKNLFVMVILIHLHEGKRVFFFLLEIILCVCVLLLEKSLLTEMFGHGIS